MIKNLIQLLKNEHKKIIELFEKIEITEEFTVKKVLFQELAATMAGHLKKEDEQLYPALEKSTIEEIKKIGSVFSELMMAYSKEFMFVIEGVMKSEIFFDTNLLESYKKIRNKIKDRVIIEENTLFPAYEKSLEI